MRPLITGVMLGILIFSMACGRKDVNRRGEIKLRGEKPVSVNRHEPGDMLQKGIASWYGPPYHGRQTANGERYDMWAMTAAHKTLPFGTMVKVVNQDNGRWTTVRINDRGPFIRGRIIDLSKAAAREIGLEASGIAPVKLYLAKTGDNSRNKPTVQTEMTATEGGGFWTIQVGSFGERPRAEAMADRMRDYSEHVMIERSGSMNRVRVGRFETKSLAGALAESLADEEIPTWIVFIED